ncbi:MAG TPA: ExeM/NucH family extracellular endonuclease, partial [Gemmatimonadaceae bacterium]|nr:ExeM/NucH family extracellular endonuclease [Gemmatimonadaceae bacterium]
MTFPDRFIAPRPVRALLLLAALSACSTNELTSPVSPVRSPVSLAVAPARGVVISQVYGGGGNAGGQYRNDFIELYNQSDIAVSLQGWSVQYAAAAGVSYQMTQLTGQIAPGGYYLVQQAVGANVAALPLPTPDAIGTIAMSGTAGKVALVNGTAALTAPAGGCPSPTAPAAIQDFVSFGTTATCAEGGAPTPTLSNSTAALRRNGGVTDTDNNGADFTVGSPNPRNGAASPPFVAINTPATGALDVAAGSNITVGFSRPVTVSGDWYAISCTSSGVHPATVTGGPTQYTLDPVTNFSSSESCSVTIVAAQVAAAGDAAIRMLSDFSWSFTTASGNVCLDPFTPAHVIQGNVAASPLLGQTVTTSGVVVGDFEGPAPALRGFYLQDATGDGDASTSDAIFVFNGSANSVSVGDIVRVSGRVDEFQEQTQVASVTNVTVCGTGGSVTPVEITLPVASSTFLERVEGMLVKLPQTLTVTDHFFLGRFGQVSLSFGARLAQPTNVVAPGAAALALQAQNNLNRIIVDDAQNAQNPDPIVFGRNGQPLSASNTLRGGDQATGITGVLSFGWAGNNASGNAYRVRPVGSLNGVVPTFVAVNQRTAAPAAVGGSLKVGALNVLNYFNSFSGCRFGVGGASADCRGANSATEFERQAAKTVSAIIGMNTDVVGVIEIENDGYGPTSAIAEL